MGGGVHCAHGCLFGICVEKNAEIDTPHRKFKGCVLSKGTKCTIKNIITLSSEIWESSPSTLQAAQVVDFYGCLSGHVWESC